ncbi:MAG: NAD(P)H-dependent oxidoreductase subunit E [Proteobacteria bacterium]|nr:NAD(P)H-dependent oxidoreductase subunit E [Pseudomonadota bacterium]RTL29353.1 MAG: (2Fe-2S) ferredoxin domain-containing protein [Rhodocyclaceae bacterium]
MSYFKHHVFFCCNQRGPGETCCAAQGAVELQTYAKDRIAALGLKGKGKVRINKAGCLDRCDEGPVLVVYPDNVWYTFVDKSDVDEIISEHLQHGRIVERLKI